MNIRECTLANLIAYHPEKDLLPLVIATRNYTLLQGRDTQAEHDLLALQRQIEERFIRGKTRVEPDVMSIIFCHEKCRKFFFIEFLTKVIFICYTMKRCLNIVLSHILFRSTNGVSLKFVKISSLPLTFC